MSVYSCLSQKWENKYSEMASDVGKMREHVSYGNKKYSCRLKLKPLNYSLTASYGHLNCKASAGDQLL